LVRTPGRLGAPARAPRAARAVTHRGRTSRAAATGLASALLLLAACGGSGTTASTPSVRVVPGMPSVVDARNLYSEIGVGRLSPATKGARFRVYVPNLKSNDVYVIDPKTLQVVDRYPSGGIDPQHVVPSYDLKTLWIANEDVPGSAGTVVPIDPRTGKPGDPIAVDNPYNLYFTPDGRSVIVVAEQRKRLDFLDPHTFAFQATLPLPGCAGPNHGDFSIDGSYLILSCEFERGLVKVDWRRHAVLGYLRVAADAVPQDVRVSPSGATFYVADLQRGGLYTVDGNRFAVTGFIPTTIGAHGLVVGRDGTKLYVANRGSQTQGVGPGHGPGSVSVLDFATNQVVATWPIPGGGSPDMGNVTPDGRQLFVSGRFDDVVYVFDTKTGAERTIPVGREPHGVAVWPQPGRYSLGHTGNMR
jgi:YVTN family beta-propeller protein